MVAMWSRCGRDVVTVWWCYWSDAPCIRHAPYCDVQDANEMRTVENAKWYISSISGVYRILPHPIYTMYISRDFNFLLFIGRSSLGLLSVIGR